MHRSQIGSLSLSLQKHSLPISKMQTSPFYKDVKNVAVLRENSEKVKRSIEMSEEDL